jgi:hypothetical protein
MGQYGKYGPLVRAALAAWVLLASPAEACRLALVLALDVSSSVDFVEDQLQRRGLAHALEAPDVQAAFLASPDPVALYVFEWSGPGRQTTLLDWQMITSADDLAASAARIASSQRSTTGEQTALGDALAFALRQFETGPACIFRTIDITGDGPSNAGPSPEAVYASLAFDGVLVNGLVIDAGAIDVTDYYENRVKRGPGAFVEIARGFSEFETTMERKLIRELSSQVIGRTEGMQGVPG